MDIGILPLQQNLSFPFAIHFIHFKTFAVFLFAFHWVSISVFFFLSFSPFLQSIYRYILAAATKLFSHMMQNHELNNNNDNDDKQKIATTASIVCRQNVHKNKHSIWISTLVSYTQYLIKTHGESPNIANTYDSTENVYE